MSLEPKKRTFDWLIDIGLSSSELDFDIASYFEPYVQQWLANTDSKTAQWVNGVC